MIPGLGTVQLGLPYGNRAREPLMSEADAFAVLDAAASQRVRFFDTAAAYGESEARVGAWRRERASYAAGVEVSTKVPAAPLEVWFSPSAYERFVRASIARSRALLGVDRLGLLQFHQCDVAFLSAPHVGALMASLLEEGECEAVGVSVYDLEQAACALALPCVSALQVPVNLLDDRFVRAPWALPEAQRQRPVRLLARSIFLQGVLLPDVALPVVSRREDLATLRSLATVAAQRAGVALPAAAVAFAFAGQRDKLSVGLLGCDSAQAVTQNLAWVADAPTCWRAELFEAFAEARAFAFERGLYNPARW